MKKMLITTTIMFAISFANAGFSPILNNSGEDNVAEILNDVLGTSYSLSDLNSGSAGRVNDDIGSVWHDGIVKVTFTAIWWGNSFQNTDPAHLFGYTLNNGPAVKLFSTDDSGADPGTSYTSGGPVGAGDIRFFAANSRNGITAWSDDTLNSTLRNGETDRMAAFDVSGMDLNLFDADGDATVSKTTGDNAYLLFFDTGYDSDYQDLVVLVEGPQPGDTPPAPIVPAPAALMLACSGLATLGAIRKK